MTEHPGEPVLAIEPAPVAVRRILVLKLDHRGDFIMATPGFEALRAAFPAAHITLVCGDWNRDEAEAAGLFDRVLGSAFFPEVVQARSRVIGDDASRLAFARLAGGERYDLAVDLRLHADTRSLLTLVDAGVRAGFGMPGQFPFLDVVLPFAPDGAGQSLLRRIPAERFGTAQPRIHGWIEAGPATPGEIAVWGPYETFEAGEWDIELAIRPSAAPFALGYDVVADGVVLDGGEIAVRDGPFPRIALHLAEAAREMEVRLRGGDFRFFGIVARRRGTFAGPHQAEMQYLLCCLVGLRLRHFWRVEAGG